MAGPQRLRHGEKTGSSHPDTINFISAVFVNSQLGEIFKTIINVHKGMLTSLLSPILFNMFVEKFLQDILHDHRTFIFIGRPLCNLRIADDIDLMDDSNDVL